MTITIAQLSRLAREKIGPATIVRVVQYPSGVHVRRGVDVYNEFGGEFLKVRTGKLGNAKAAVLAALEAWHG